ncbi:LysR family transcriptional regulator [Larsenimonas salina]|uniref:LysR family transcriptional regulator n=1 Tax=Larsenimonas salina TaxID=1295565 RepID=UPI002072CDE2|nr:LysR family transcriptional regulator [Larsenimonas salina]MCM5705416.1 LysR family transcriptional regulator [Larsenimonas salina]
MTVLPPLAWLQAFEAAARLMSFTAAGEELCISQSAVSQRIRLLEGRLGEPLFIRHPNTLSLTETGLAWLPSVQGAFEMLTESTAEVFGKKLAEPVLIRSTPVMQHYWLSARLASWCRSISDDGFKLVTAVWPRDFSVEDVDFEVRYGRGQWPGVEAVSLGEETLEPVCTPELAKQLSSPDDLGLTTLIHSAGFDVGWPAWLARFNRSALEHKHSRLTCDTQLSAIAIAREGVGVALVHSRWLDQLEPALISPFKHLSPSQRQVIAREGFWLARSKQKPVRPDANALWQWLIDSEDNERERERSASE